MKPNNNNTILLTMFLLSLFFASCSKEQLTGDIVPEINLFVPDDADQSEEANLRRSFYEQTGSYLLFNDTLRRANHTRVLSIPYSVTITGTDYYEAQLYRLKYLQSLSEYRQAAEFIRNKVASFVAKSTMPYSLLLVDTITSYPYNRSRKTYNMDKPDDKHITVFGMQTLAIAGLKDVGTKSNDEQHKLAVIILNNLVMRVIQQADAETLAPFYAISKAYYGKAFSEEEGNMPNIKDIRELGFLKSYYFKKEKVSFYPADRDLEVFLKELLGKPEAEWRKSHADYPLVIRKLEILKALIEKKGISLDYLG